MKRNLRYIDLSWTLDTDVLVYPGDPAFVVQGTRNPDEDGFSLKSITSAMHVGTHLDAPSHYLAKGGTVEAIPLEKTLGYVNKLTIKPVKGVISTEAIKNQYLQAKEHFAKIVICSGFSSERFKPTYFTDFPSFEPSLFEFLSANQIELFGVDMPSVKYTLGGAASMHHDLLSKQIVIVENLINLEATDDVFFLMAAPLKIAKMDGSFIRAIAINGPITF